MIAESFVSENGIIEIAELDEKNFVLDFVKQHFHQLVKYFLLRNIIRKKEGFCET